MEKELIDALRQFKKRDVDTFSAEVISVDKTKGTCKVTDGNLQFTDVRLTAVINGVDNKFFLFPVVGSSVLVSPINEDLKNLYIEAYSEIESFDLNIEGVSLNIDKEGFLLKKQNETLKILIVDLIEAIENQTYLVSTTGTATAQTGSTTSLNNKAQFVAIKNRFKQFLK